MSELKTPHKYGVPVYAITPVLLHKYVFFARNFFSPFGLWVTKKILLSPPEDTFPPPVFE